MISQDDARKVADGSAAGVALEHFNVAVVEQPDAWVYTYTFQVPVRGAGFQITVSKTTGQVTDVLRFQ